MSMLRRNVTLLVFAIVYGYFLLGGLGSYWLANHVDIPGYDFDYGVDMIQPIVYAILALCCLLAAYWTVTLIPRRRKPLMIHSSHESDTSLGSIDLASVSALFAMGTLGLLMMIGQYGGRIPAFVENADEFRTNLTSGLPQVLYFELILSTLVAYSMLLRPGLRRQRRYLKLIICLSLFFIYLGASRSMLVTPVLVIMLDSWRRGRLKWWHTGLGLLAIGAVVFLVGLFRMDAGIERDIYLLRFVADFAPEFREFAKLLTYMPDHVGYLHGQMFANGVLILVPGKVAEVLGVSKAEYWLPFGEYLKNLFNYEFVGGGLRAGLIAEYYANFGVFGIVAGFYFMGLLLRYLEDHLRGAGPTARVFTLAIALSLATSVLFTFDAVVYKIVSLGVGWVLYRTIRFVLVACRGTAGRSYMLGITKGETSG